MVVDRYIYMYIYKFVGSQRSDIKVHTEEDTESENRIPVIYGREQTEMRAVSRRQWADVFFFFVCCCRGTQGEHCLGTSKDIV